MKIEQLLNIVELPAVYKREGKDCFMIPTAKNSLKLLRRRLSVKEWQHYLNNDMVFLKAWFLWRFRCHIMEKQETLDMQNILRKMLIWLKNTRGKIISIICRCDVLWQKRRKQRYIKLWTDSYFKWINLSTIWKWSRRRKS